MKYLSIILISLTIINVFGFILVAVDKRKARRHQWRISEKTFFIISALGGGPGIYASLFVFRHKTRHLSFMLGIPLIILIQLALLFCSINLLP